MTKIPPHMRANQAPHMSSRAVWESDGKYTQTMKPQERRFETAPAQIHQTGGQSGPQLVKPRINWSFRPPAGIGGRAFPITPPAISALFIEVTDFEHKILFYLPKIVQH